MWSAALYVPGWSSVRKIIAGLAPLHIAANDQTACLNWNLAGAGNFHKQRAGQTGFLLGMERKKFSYSGAMLRRGCLAVLLALFKNWASWLGVCWNIAHKVDRVRLTMETKG